MWFLYDLGIRLLILGIRIASPFSPKAKLLIEGRKLQNFSIPDQDRPVICFHCSSLGEYEMIVPILNDASFQKKYFIIVTFFSSSGYVHAKWKGLVDAKFYLPFDKRETMNDFLDGIKPDEFVFVKNDFWFRLIQALADRKIKTVLVNGLLRPNQFLFTSAGSFFRHQLDSLDTAFVQNVGSAQLLKNSTRLFPAVTNDLRFDRVFDICQQAQSLDLLEDFKQGKPLLILGSSWPTEEKMLLSIFESVKPYYKIVIAPHDISTKHVGELRNQFSGSVVNLWSDEANPASDILIIDSIGLLASSYRHADVALIGGGFGKGLHNILEAASYGMPIFCGPKIGRFQEAKDLEELLVLRTFNSSYQLLKGLNEFVNDSDKRLAVKQTAYNYVREHTGARHKILDYFLQS